MDAHVSSKGGISADGFIELNLTAGDMDSHVVC